jgi:hypothetical protein
MGINLDSLLLSPETKEFQALSKRFFKAGKDLFPGRITDADIGIILEMIPDASKSIEGNERILDALDVANDAKKLRFDTMRQVIKENKGRVPKDLETEINAKIGDQLDDLYEKFMDAAQARDIKADVNDSYAKTLGRRLV